MKIKNPRTDNRLFEYVWEDLQYYLDEGEDELKNYVQDVTHYGCKSGIVTDLIYFNQTVEFFNRFKEEINALLAELMTEELGETSITRVVADFDTTDPLILHTNNQNLLAWFAYEQTLYLIALYNNLI